MIIEDIISIDEFKSGYKYYFLTHYHSDHYKGLKKTWNEGQIIATDLTCKLLNLHLGIDEKYLRPIKLNQKYDSNREKISFTAIDAGHCPGAVMFIFNINGKKIVYTGDFRINKKIRDQVELLRNPEILYLDTTYQKIKKKFPTQEEAINQAIDIINDFPEYEIFVAIYTIGKNRLIKKISKHFDKKFYVTKDIYNTWEIIDYHHYATTENESTNFKAYQRAWFGRKRYMPKNAVAIIPTAMPGPWDYINGNVFRVNYSEHCDIFELKEFAEMVKPKIIVDI